MSNILELNAIVVDQQIQIDTLKKIVNNLVISDLSNLSKFPRDFADTTSVLSKEQDKTVKMRMIADSRIDAAIARIDLEIEKQNIQFEADKLRLIAKSDKKIDMTKGGISSCEYKSIDVLFDPSIHRSSQDREWNAEVNYLYGE